MIHSLEMQNFRGHRSLRMEGLGRINLLMGKNNAGKTAVLEALLLLGLPSNPAGAIQAMNKVRRYEGWNSWPDSWTSLFHGTPDAPFRIAAASATPRFQRSLVGRQTLASALPGLPRDLNRQITAADLIRSRPRLQLEYSLSEGNVTLAIAGGREGAEIVPEGGKAPGPSADLNLVFSPAHDFFDSHDLARRYSRAVLDGTEAEAVEALRLVDPRLRRVLVLAMAEGAATFVELDGQDKLIPASLMGDGMVRLLGILLNMPDARGGLFLLDEAENGIHHSAMKSVWRTIFQMAERLDIQLFASTHSYESIGAVQAALRELGRLDELRLWRLEQAGDHTRAVDYMGDDISTAIDAGYEIR